jgi:hypothetical protein
VKRIVRLLCFVAAAGILPVVAFVAPAPAAGAGQPPLVSFRQSGGFVGLERSFLVRRSGEVVTRGIVVSRLPPKRLAELRKALVEARWPKLARHYAPRVHVADGFVYTITYGGRRVWIDQGARLPERLRRPLALLRDLVPLSR